MSLRRFLSLATVLAAFLWAAPAQAQQVKLHREHCAGTLDALQPGALSFSGRGTATHFGRYSIEGGNAFDDAGHVLDGHFTTTAADGSSISGIYSGTYTVEPDGSVRFDVTVDWLQGDGRLAGVTGQAEVVAFLDALEPGAAFEYFTDGFLLFP